MAKGSARYYDKVVFPTSPRMCINCQEMFESTGKGNRRCQPCKNGDSQLSKRQTEQVSFRGHT